jgi:hypothetical protein
LSKSVSQLQWILCLKLLKEESILSKNAYRVAIAGALGLIGSEATHVISTTPPVVSCSAFPRAILRAGNDKSTVHLISGWLAEAAASLEPEMCDALTHHGALMTPHHADKEAPRDSCRRAKERYLLFCVEGR